jgi:Transcriptional regulator, AbiEi antitoxin, Type IV TA system
MLKKTKVMKNYDDLQKNAILSLENCLRQIGGITDFNTKIPQETIQKADFSAAFTYNRHQYNLLGEVFNNGQPREARIAVERFRNYLAHHPKAYAVMFAPYISDEADLLCKEARISTMDLAGNCRLEFDGFFLKVKNQKNPFVRRTYLTTLYSPKAARVLRVLLVHPKRFWKMQDLAQEASVSLAHVAHVKKHLLDREWIKAERANLALIKPEELLREWAANYDKSQDTVQQFYSLRDLDEMRGIFQEAYGRRTRQFALSGFTGAAFYYPFTVHDVEMAYATDMVLTPAALGLKEVESGGNFALVKPGDEGVFYGLKVMDGIPVAHPIQIYLELIGNKGRGKEAAEALLEEVIKPTWR